MERCGKINAVNSVAESWTGIGVVTGFGASVLIRQRPHVKRVDTDWRIKLFHILQYVISIYKTRNRLNLFNSWRTLGRHRPPSCMCACHPSWSLPLSSREATVVHTSVGDVGGDHEGPRGGGAHQTSNVFGL